MFENTRRVNKAMAEIWRPARFSMSRSGFRNMRAGLLDTAVNIVKPLLLSLPATCFAYDGKTITTNTTEKNKTKDGREILAASSTGLEEADDIGLGALPTIKVDSDSTKNAESLMKTIEEILTRIFPGEELRKYVERLVAITFDTTGHFLESLLFSIM